MMDVPLQIDIARLADLVLSKDVPKIFIVLGFVLVVAGMVERVPRFGGMGERKSYLSIVIGLLLMFCGGFGYPVVFEDVEGDEGTGIEGMRVDEISISAEVSTGPGSVDRPNTTDLDPNFDEISLSARCPYSLDVEIRISVAGGRGNVTYQFLQNDEIVDEATIEFTDSTSRVLTRTVAIDRSGRYVYAVRIRSPADNEVDAKRTSVLDVTCVNS